MIDRNSGHYTPGEKFLEQVLIELSARVIPFSHKEVPPVFLFGYDIFPGKIYPWTTIENHAQSMKNNGIHVPTITHHNSIYLTFKKSDNSLGGI